MKFGDITLQGSYNSIKNKEQFIEMTSEINKEKIDKIAKSIATMKTFNKLEDHEIVKTLKEIDNSDDDMDVSEGERIITKFNTNAALNNYDQENLNDYLEKLDLNNEKDADRYQDNLLMIEGDIEMQKNKAKVGRGPGSHLAVNVDYQNLECENLTSPLKPLNIEGYDDGKMITSQKKYSYQDIDNNLTPLPSSKLKQESMPLKSNLKSKNKPKAVDFTDLKEIKLTIPDSNTAKKNPDTEEEKRNLEKEKTMAGKLNTEEKRFTGQVTCKIWWRYLSADGIPFFILNFIIFGTVVLFKVFSDWWAGEWAAKSFSSVSENAYAGVYFLFVCMSSIFIIIRSWTFGTQATQTSTMIHNSMLSNVIHRPMSFFDTTPIGMIMNRFTKDLDDVDNGLPMFLTTLGQMTFLLIFTLI